MAVTWSETLADYLADLGAEAAKDFYGEQYVTLPTGGVGEAIEIEKLGRYIFTVYLRTWDRTNGLTDEKLVYEGQDSVGALEAVRRTNAECKAALDALEALLATCPDED